LRANVLLDVLLEVACVMKSAVADEFDVAGYAEEAMSAASEYMEAGEEEMAKMAESAKAQRIKANIHINAPKINIPSDCMSTQQPSVKLDLGGLAITSKLAQPTEADPKTMTNPDYIYDTYFVSLDGVNCMVFWPAYEVKGEKVSEWNEDILKPFAFHL
jgi:prophage tail gpP-like protein